MVKISLPNPNDFDTEVYEGMRSFLRQLELALHHAQKSLETMKEEGEITEDSFIVYRFPKIDLHSREQDKEGNVMVHVDEEGDQMQNIEIDIH